jgi:hypothetical protein
MILLPCSSCRWKYLYTDLNIFIDLFGDALSATLVKQYRMTNDCLNINIEFTANNKEVVVTSLKILSWNLLDELRKVMKIFSVESIFLQRYEFFTGGIRKHANCSIIRC